MRSVFITNPFLSRVAGGKKRDMVAERQAQQGTARIRVKHG
jgi:hypothetical protein